MGSNASIAKNSAFLFVRMLISMGVSFYTSRAILQLLGIEDFGIYNLVAGVIASFSFIANTIISANSRFLSFSIGLNDIAQLKKTFSLCVTSSIITALVLVIFCETLGLWWIFNKINIPDAKFFEAQIVFHIAVLNLFFTIVFTPFNALIISFEKMNIYAIVSVVNSLLNLLVVFLLYFNYSGYSNLIMYGALSLVVNLGISGIYYFYSRTKFKVEGFSICFDKELKKIFTYSSWDIYGNLAVTARTSGVAILQNMFFGVVANAAIGIATQVQNLVNQFSSNILFASKPQVIKRYASGDIDGMIDVINKTVLFTSVLLSLVVVPLIVEMDSILIFWLGILPEHTVAFVQWFLLFIFGANISQCLLMGIHATGKVRNSSIINGTLYLFVIPLSYWAFSKDFAIEFPYILNFLFILIGGLLNAFYLKREVRKFDVLAFYRNCVLPIIVISVLNYLLLIGLKSYTGTGFFAIISTFLFSSCFTALWIWFFVFDKGIKEKSLNYLKEKWSKI